MLLEACADSLFQALLAEAGGAHRIELCSRLDLDGLSPDRGIILQALRQLKIPVKIMIRPREGDFIFSEEEIQEMEREIHWCKKAGVREIVTGASLPSGALDIATLRRLASAAEPMTVTIHKAIDLSPDPLAELESLRPIANITHILTSGKQATALEGAPLLREMIRAAGDRFVILVAGKVTWENLEEVGKATGAREYHGKRIVKSLTFEVK
ncbi:MAG: copper homeostasis protein CutC [Saprospiraceae bacterium]